MKLYFANEVLYRAQPRQQIFHRAVKRAQILLQNQKHAPYNFLYGGAAGGGKTEALLWEIWRWGTNKKYSKLRIGVFRKTFPEVEKYFINRAREAFPNSEEEPMYKYREQKHTLTFLDTGTVVEFNQCENEADVYKHQGAAWDILIIDEITHFTEYQVKYLRTRNRPSKGGIKCGFKPLFICATNPGNVGHQFVKRWWIDKSDYVTGEGRADDYLFVPAKIWDNKILLDSDPNYVEKLKALPEMDRRALLEGDWDIFAGQYFTEIRREIHSFHPVEMGVFPKNWGLFIVLDYGFYPHPASVGWYAVDENGWLYRYKELLAQRYTTTDLAKKIVMMTTEEESKRIEYIIVPHDLYAKRGNKGGKSGVEEMQEVFDLKHWLCLKADNDRVNGWYQVREYLKPFKYDKQIIARLRISQFCHNFWKQMPMLQHDPHRPEDILKQGVSPDGKIWEGDDVADEVRYAIMSRFSPAKLAEKKKKELDRYGHPIQSKSKTIRPDYKKPQMVWDNIQISR